MTPRKQRAMRGAMFFGCVLGLGLPCIALEQEFDNCVGTRFESLSEIPYPTVDGSGFAYIGGANTCSTEIQDSLGSGLGITHSYCGLGTKETLKCCNTVRYTVVDASAPFPEGTFLWMFNNIKVKGNVSVDELAKDIEKNNVNPRPSLECAGNVEQGSSAGCGETCAFGLIGAFKIIGEGTLDPTVLKYCAGKIKVNTEENGAVSSFECGEVVPFSEIDFTFPPNPAASSSSETSVPLKEIESGEDRADNDGNDDEDDDEDENDSQCFPAAATVQLQTGAVKKMSDLVVGDVVRVSATEYSPVFMFTHKLAHVVNSFVELRTASGHHLSATPGHYVYVNGDLAPARGIRVGDYLTVDSGEDSVVTEVSRAQREGLYNPQTIQGDVAVNGVVSSTYTTAVEPAVAHGILAPLRAVYSIFGTDFRSQEDGRAL